MKLFRLMCIVLILLSSCSKPYSEEDEPKDIISVVATPLPTPSEALVPEENTEFIDTQRSDFSSVLIMSGDGVSYSREVIDGNHHISIEDWPDSQNTIELSCYGLALRNGESFSVSFTVESDVASNVTVQLSSYDTIYHEKTYSVSSSKVVDRFTVGLPSFYDGKLKLIFHRGNEQTTGTIKVSQLSVSSQGSVKINQVGYLPQTSKIAVFSYNAGDVFEVVDIAANEVVYRGLIEGKTENEAAGEKNYIGDFSSLTKEGRYKIVTNYHHESVEFEIRDGLYDSLLKDSLIALSSQRCGQKLRSDVFGALAHEVCHHMAADVEVNDTYADVQGGWHDAGDYGRYVCPGVKAVSDLLLAYVLYPEIFTDDMGIMESGNGVSDVLDEARVELEWLLKMQRSDSNAFYNSVITKVFADMVSPEDDLMQLYVLKQENTATAAASAALAFGSIVFKEIDPDFSERCLDSAIRGFAHAEWQRGSEDIRNPEHFSGGDYANVSDYDELYYAAMALYAATSDEHYLQEAKILAESCSVFDFTYDSFGGYGTAVYLLYGEDSDYLRKMKIEYAKSCQGLMDRSNQDGYLTASSRVYSWNGNMHVANAAMQLLIGYRLFEDDTLLKTVQNQLDYILGKNAINLSFVSGYGVNSVKNLHNRLTISHASVLDGFVVAGIDKKLENSILSSLISKEIPDAKRFIDHPQSYSNTEVAIYQNSVFIFVVGALNSLY